ncbi:MAG: hypothetical protein ACOWWH_13065 [Eubacteriaceae bacterium]
MKKKYKIFLLVLLCLFIFTGCGYIEIAGCDHTQLSGEIVITDKEIKVGDKIPLTLEVPEELSGIYRTMWDVTPDDVGKIIEGDQLLEEFSDDELELYFGESENLNPDRIGLFIANKKGECIIYTAGFYKQTNPQGITYLEIEVK